jgi:hypothetical protein
MSVDLVHAGRIERQVTTALADTNLTAILSSPVTKQMNAKVASIAIANVDTSNAIAISLYYNDGTNDYLFARYKVPADDTVIIDSLPIVLNDGWTLKAQAATGAKLTVTVILATLAAQG